MTTIDQFVTRLNTVGRRIELFADPILTRFGDIIADQVEAEAPKRTRARAGGGMKQIRPGVLELQGGHLIGEVRGTSQRSPKSRTFLTDAFDDVSGPMAAAVAEIAVSVLTDDVVTRRRR
jgi:hypothetical protein